MTTPSSSDDSPGGPLTTNDLHEWKGVVGSATMLLGDDHLERLGEPYPPGAEPRESHLLDPGRALLEDS